MNIENNLIREIRIFGDYFGQGEVSELEAALAGTCYDPKALGQKLDQLDINHYFAGLSKEELLSAML